MTGRCSTCLARLYAETAPTAATRAARRPYGSAPPTAARGRAARAAACLDPTMETNAPTQRCPRLGGTGRRRAAPPQLRSAREARQGRGKRAASGPCAGGHLATRGSPAAVGEEGMAVAVAAQTKGAAAGGGAQSSRHEQRLQKGRNWCPLDGTQRRTASSPILRSRAPPQAAMRAAGAWGAGVPRAARQVLCYAGGAAR